MTFVALTELYGERGVMEGSYRVINVRFFVDLEIDVLEGRIILEAKVDVCHWRCGKG